MAEGRGDGGPRGSLSVLLAGRLHKLKSKHQNAQKLREKALNLLSRHQNLGDLLEEMGGCSVCQEASGAVAGRGASVPDLLLVPALQDQASALGLPVGVLSARIAAGKVEELSAESGQAVLLKGEQRAKFSSLLDTLKDLSAWNAFSHLQFAQEMWKMPSPLPLEIAWQLHSEGLVSLEELLGNNPDASMLVDWLCSSLCFLCHQTENHPLEAEFLGSILKGFMALFLRHRFQKTSEPGKKLELQQLSKVYSAVLERMLAWVLDSVPKEKQEDASALKAVKNWLCVFTVKAYQDKVLPEALQEFFSHTLTQVLTYNPQLKVSDAIHLQREWSFARTSSVLILLYSKLFVPFRAEELVRHLQQVLEASEVNWHHVLSCVSIFLVCHSEAASLIKDFLGCLLKKAFEDFDLENMMTAFLIARQAALEGPAIFMPYSEWFKVAFGSARGFHSGSKKALVFLFKFLSELVPFEAPQYLKVHIMHPPFVPCAYRTLLLEYITLAKTRLADFKISIEDMGLYEDLSSPKEAIQPHCQAIQDVEKAVRIFENTGKIPTSVMEASIFRQSYYTTRFIPALLVPRGLPETPDSRMAFIDSLKRAEKIPLSVYATYIEECRAAKEKLVGDGSAEVEASDLEEPLGQLEAELQPLGLLIRDESKHGELPAQISRISGKLADVLGHRTDEEEAASMDLRIQLNLSNPEVQQHHQEAVDLLLTSFCKNATFSSNFLAPESQGPWASLFVRMICGHRQVLPSLLSRLCQLIYHQGCSLKDCHIVGLAVFVFHLNEAKSLIPPVDLCSPPVPSSASLKGLSVTELWDYFLVCQTGESLTFCMRFCTAVLCYFFCKIGSFPLERIRSLLHPGLVKKLQYVVPRLFLEARAPHWRGRTDSPLRGILSHLNRCYLEATLRVYVLPRFQDLLREKAFQLTLQEWLLMELEVHPDKDILSASQRQEFHHWALYQHYLLRPSAAGGCDGGVRGVCAVLIDTLLDFWHRSELGKHYHPSNPNFSTCQSRGNPDIYGKLQEMLLEVELGRRRALPAVRGKEEHLLFQVFRKRLKALGDGTALAERMQRQQELFLQTRILLGLPPSVLIATQKKGKEVALDCEDFLCFVNTELRNVCSRGCTLSYDITAHFFRGLLSSSLECDKPAQEVTAVFALCQAKYPIFFCSAARWWPSLEPVLCSEWERLFDAPLAQGLESLKALQASVDSFLTSEAASLVADIPWLSAAFLHFTLQQQMGLEKAGEVLEKLGPGAEQLLVSLLFFSVMDLISAKVAPQEGVDVQKAVDWSAKVLGCAKERGAGWLSVFSSTEPGQSPDQILRGAASNQHLKLLPIAFYSFLFAFDSGRVTGEPGFLRVALDMYTQLLQLFREGTAEVGPSLREPKLCAREPEESLALIRAARQFLLREIPRCPRGSFSNLQQLLDLCGILDPEIKAALVDSGTEGGDLLEEEPLLF